MLRVFCLATLLVLCAAAPRLAAQEDDDPELRGDVVSATTGEPIAGAWIAMEGYGYGTYSRRDGDFRLPDVPDGPRRFDVRALGYVAETIMLDPTSGEQVIELDPDPALHPGLEFLLAHLEDRRNAGRVFDREALAFSGAYDLGEFLRMRGVRRVRKFCLDEETAPGLQTVPPEDFYMVEMHGSTARVYTEEFLERTAREDAERMQEIVRLRMPMC
ncbi:MAG TPA: carboxypeptidase regulatory-like domain-containing protein [Longimicrobiales bacterium]|nr:carboxypeptidase regulatory-like domain-containing protein [Longimicrobiales bacterium]